jgi:hypothetical protein
MTINAQLPDGTTLQFPDETSDATIDAAVTSHVQQNTPQHPAAGPSGDLTTDIPRRLATAGIDAIAGLGSTPRAIAQGVDWLGSKVGLDVGADPALASLKRSTGEQSFPDFQTLRERGFADTGATEYVPQTTPGKMVQAGLTAVPSVLLGGGVRAALPAFAGGATGELGSELWPDHPFLGRLLGFVLGSHTAAAVGNAASRTVANATGIGGPTTPIGQAYQRQGITPTTSVDDATNAWQTAAETAAQKLGPGATQQETGAALQGAVNQWKSDWQANANTKWDAFRTQVPSDTQIPVSGFQKALTGVNQDYGGAANLAKTLQPSLGTTIQDALTKDISPTGTLPWQAVQATRTRLGQLMQSSDPDVATVAKRLYGGLSDDMQNGALAAGSNAAQAFKEASDYTWAGHRLLDDHLNPILRASTPEQAAQYALATARQGGTRLQAIGVAAPDQPTALGAGIVRQAADVGPDMLAKRMNALSPEARTQLFGGPGVGTPAGDLGDLVDIAAKQRQIQQTATPPRFSSDAGRFVTAMEAGRAGHEIAGTPGRIAGLAAGYLAAPALPYLERQVAANRLMSGVYGPRVTPFQAAPVWNALIQPTR